MPDWSEFDKKLDNKSLAQVKPEEKFDVLTKPVIKRFKKKLENQV